MKKIYKVSIFAVIILIAAVILYELVIKKNAGYKSEEISTANNIISARKEGNTDEKVNV